MWGKLKRIGGAALEGASYGSTIGGAAGGVVGTVGGLGIASMATGPAGMAVGGTIGAITGGLVGAIKEAFWGEPGKAKGGIAEGPESGFIEKLHGAEAVIPLDNNRSVPVSLDVSGMAKTLADVAAGAGIGKAATGAMSAGASMFSLGGMPTGQDPSDLLQQNLAILRDIKDVLTNSQSLQEQFVQNTYQ
jgi:hypothetical protein